MCGIVGIVSTQLISEANLEFMNNKMFHRGPDGHGLHLESSFGFGHRRLSIVDLSQAGHQPMHYLDRYTITYNGEVYNHLELRAELELEGYIFSSSTDTEVIMAAYDHWGVECFNKFNGMWAFCIYDRHKDEFIFSRDRFGIKPLYYWFDGEVFVFASEIKAILAYEHFGDVKPNLDYLNQYLESGPKEEIKHTSFEGVYRFNFNAYLIASKEQLIVGELDTKQFWHVEPNIDRCNFNQAELERYADGYRELLKDSVKLRLRADVKVGSALSGGIDSSSIVSMINQVHQESGLLDMQETFSSVYKTAGTEECDESQYIDELARYLNVKSNQIEPKPEDIPEQHAKMIYHFETPPKGTAMSGWHTFKLVAQTDVTVTLDGQGADEQLAGYDGYVTNYIANTNLTTAFIGCFNIKQKLLRKRAFKGFLVNFTKNIFGLRLASKLLHKFISNMANQVMPLNQKLHQDMTNNLITLIHYSDRVSMAHSIESRMPFMDYRLVEYLASVPDAYKFHKGWSKYLSRAAMKDLLPSNILWRKDKMGWPIPEKHWFEGIHKQWMDSTILKSEFLKKYYQDSLMCYTNLGLQEKLKLLNLAVWSKTFCVK